MGQTLLDALSSLGNSIKQHGENAWLPTDDWSWYEPERNCVLTAERNQIVENGPLAQRLTYGALNEALVAVWGAMYKAGNFYECEFEMRDPRWGVVGAGSMRASEAQAATS